MTSTPLPIARAIAHGVAACAIVVTVAVPWHWLPGVRDTAAALITVAAIGALVWIGATMLADTGLHPPPADNDNHPFDPLYLGWTPIDGSDTSATIRPR